jgi:hypothetical protein
MKSVLRKLLNFTLLIALLLYSGNALAGVQSDGERGRAGKTPIKKAAPRRGARKATRRAPAAWHTFTGPDSDFRVQFPSKPAREEDAPGVIGMIRRYSSTTGTYYFGIVYQDLGPAASDLTPTHEEATAALLEEKGHKVVSVRRLSRNTTQTELWSPSQTPGKFMHRIERTVVSHDRMYTLGCGSRIAEQEVDKAVCRRFFDSFRLIGVPQ